MNKNLIKIISAICFALGLLSSCVKEPEFDIVEGDGNLAISLNFHTQSDTRSSTSASVEDKIDDVLFFMIDKGTHTVHSVIEGSKDSSAPNKFDVALQFALDESLEREFFAYVLVNAKDELDGVFGNGYTLDFFDGMDYAELSGLSNRFTPPNSSSGNLVMWGMLPEVSAFKRNTVPTKFDIILLRSVARIDVGVGRINPAGIWDGLKADGSRVPFILRSVKIYRANVKSSLFPNVDMRDHINSFGIIDASDLRYPNFKVTKPSAAGDLLPINSEIHSYTNNNQYNSGSPEYSITQKYMPESDIVATGAVGDKNHTNRCAVVFGGFYDGSDVETFYRVDLKKYGENPSLINVLRNHNYRLMVSNVSMVGAATAEDAYRNVDIKFDIDAKWDVTSIVGDIHGGELKAPSEVVMDWARLGSSFNSGNIEYSGRDEVKIYLNDSTTPITLTGGTVNTLHNKTGSHTWLTATVEPSRDKKSGHFNFSYVVDASTGKTPFKIKLVSGNITKTMTITYDNGYIPESLMSGDLANTFREVERAGSYTLLPTGPNDRNDWAVGGFHLARMGDGIDPFASDAPAESQDSYSYWVVEDLNSLTYNIQPSLFKFNRGMFQTIDLVNAVGAGQSTPAVDYCKTMGNGYYLPSASEFKWIANRALPYLGDSYGYKSSYYWTSTGPDYTTSIATSVGIEVIHDIRYWSNADCAFRLRCIKNIEYDKLPLVYTDDANRVVMDHSFMDPNTFTKIPKARTTDGDNLTLGSNTLGNIGSAVNDEKNYYMLEVSRTNESKNSWFDAINTCNSKAEDDGGWRLPTKRELLTIYSNRLKLQAEIDLSTFSSDTYWSATESYSAYSWYVTFNSGYVTDNNKTSSYIVRCVRDL